MHSCSNEFFSKTSKPKMSSTPSVFLVSFGLSTDLFSTFTSQSKRQP